MDLYISLNTENREEAATLLTNGCLELGLDLSALTEKMKPEMATENSPNWYFKTEDGTTDIDWVGKVPMLQEDPEAPIQFFEGIHVNIRTTKEIDLGVEDAASYVSSYVGFNLHTPPMPYRMFM